MSSGVCNGPGVLSVDVDRVLYIEITLCPIVGIRAATYYTDFVFFCFVLGGIFAERLPPPGNKWSLVD